MDTMMILMTILAFVFGFVITLSLLVMITRIRKQDYSVPKLVFEKSPLQELVEEQAREKRHQAFAKQEKKNWAEFHRLRKKYNIPPDEYFIRANYYMSLVDPNSKGFCTNPYRLQEKALTEPIEKL